MSACTGLWINRLEVDPELVIPNGSLTIAEGAISPFNRFNVEAWYMKKLQSSFRTDMDLVFMFQLAAILKRKINRLICMERVNQTYRISLGSGRSFETTYEGVIPNLERRHRETDSDFM